MVWFQETGICHLPVKNKHSQLAFTVFSTALTTRAVSNCSTEIYKPMYISFVISLLRATKNWNAPNRTEGRERWVQAYPPCLGTVMRATEMPRWTRRGRTFSEPGPGWKPPLLLSLGWFWGSPLASTPPRRGVQLPGQRSSSSSTEPSAPSPAASAATRPRSLGRAARAPSGRTGQRTAGPRCGGAATGLTGAERRRAGPRCPPSSLPCPVPVPAPLPPPRPAHRRRGRSAPFECPSDPSASGAAAPTGRGGAQKGSARSARCVLGAAGRAGKPRRGLGCPSPAPALREIPGGTGASGQPWAPLGRAQPVRRAAHRGLSWGMAGPREVLPAGPECPQPAGFAPPGSRGVWGAACSQPGPAEPPGVGRSSLRPAFQVYPNLCPDQWKKHRLADLIL